MGRAIQPGFLGGPLDELEQLVGLEGFVEEGHRAPRLRQRLLTTGWAWLETHRAQPAEVGGRSWSAPSTPRPPVAQLEVDDGEPGRASRSRSRAAASLSAAGQGQPGDAREHAGEQVEEDGVVLDDHDFQGGGARVTWATARRMRGGPGCRQPCQSGGWGVPPSVGPNPLSADSHAGPRPGNLPPSLRRARRVLSVPSYRAAGVGAHRRAGAPPLNSGCPHAHPPAPRSP